MLALNENKPKFVFILKIKQELGINGDLFINLALHNYVIPAKFF